MPATATALAATAAAAPAVHVTPAALHSDPIIRRIHACAVAGVPVVLWGGPGCGKTSRVSLYARALQAWYERFVLGRCEPIDLQPRALTDKGALVFDAPEVQRIRAAVANDTRPSHVALVLAVLFLDELNRAEKNTEGAALTLIDSPPPRTAVIAACNPPAANTASRHLSAETANRFVHLDVAADAEVWATGMLVGWRLDPSSLPIPSEADLAAARSQAAPIVAEFIRANPGEIEKEPQNAAQAGRAWPSPRSWEHAIRLYTVALAMNLPGDDIAALLHGVVGPIADALIEFIERMDLPKIEDLLANPTGWKVPLETDRCVAIVSGVQSAVSTNVTHARYTAAWKIADHMAANRQGTPATMLADALIGVWDRHKSIDPKALPAPATVMGKRVATLMAAAANASKS